MSFKFGLLLTFGVVLSVIGVAVLSTQEHAKREAVAKAAATATATADAKAAADEQAAFEALSPVEHLAEARKLLKVGEKEEAISAGLKHVAAIEKTSPIYKQAEQTRRAFREAKENHDADEAKKNALAEAARKRWLRTALAKSIENKMLDGGMNVDVSATGKDQTVLRLKWILVSKVVAHQLAKEGTFFSTAREAGFKRIEITDGYDEMWWWKLD